MTAPDTTTLRQMLDAASSGPWHLEPGITDRTVLIGNFRYTLGQPEDARLIAAAPDLAQHVIDQDAELTRLREGIEHIVADVARFHEGNVYPGARYVTRRLRDLLDGGQA